MSALQLAIFALQGDDVVAASVVGRVFAVRATQGAARPFLVVDLIGESEDQHLACATGYFEARVSVACHAANVAEANELGERVKDALGDLTNHTVLDLDSPPAPLGLVTMWKDGADVIDWSDDSSVCRRIVDFILRWRR